MEQWRQKVIARTILSLTGTGTGTGSTEMGRGQKRCRVVLRRREDGCVMANGTPWRRIRPRGVVGLYQLKIDLSRSPVRNVGD